MKMQECLRQWSGYKINAVTDEELGDIDLAIKYHDHGDEFLYVRTYNKVECIYGFWLDRINCIYDYDPERNNGESDGMFERRPILFRHPDKHSEIDNEAFRVLRDDRFGIQKHRDFGPQKYTDADARFKFCLDRIKDICKRADEKMIRYDFERKRKDLRTFIALNDLGGECEEELKKIKWDSRMNGFDGIAGRIGSNGILYGDGVISVLYKGKAYSINKLTYSVDYVDEWGCETYRLNTRQFA